MILFNIFIIFLILFFDFIWLYINANMYNKSVKQIQDKKLNINYIGAFLSYICVILSLFLFSFPIVKNEYEKNKKQSLLLLSLRYGGLLGLFIYGIFNTTNITIFTNYNIKTVILDTLWGFFSYTLITYIYSYISLKL